MDGKFKQVKERKRERDRKIRELERIRRAKIAKIEKQYGEPIKTLKAETDADFKDYFSTK